VNINGTLNILKERLNERINAVTYASFYGVYDEPVFLPLTEKHPKEPKPQNAVSKLAAERYCNFHEIYWIETIYLRFFHLWIKIDKKFVYSCDKPVC